MSLSVVGVLLSVAVAGAADAQSAPTLEAAGAFLDQVLTNGVTQFALPDNSSDWTAQGMFASASKTTGCETVVTWSGAEYRVDWGNFVHAEARTGGGLHRSYMFVAVKQSLAGRVGLLIDPVDPQMNSRLERAVKFLGESCTRKSDSPF